MDTNIGLRLMSSSSFSSCTTMINTVRAGQSQGAVNWGQSAVCVRAKQPISHTGVPGLFFTAIYSSNKSIHQSNLHDPIDWCASSNRSHQPVACAERGPLCRAQKRTVKMA